MIHTGIQSIRGTSSQARRAEPRRDERESEKSRRETRERETSHHNWSKKGGLFEVCRGSVSNRFYMRLCHTKHMRMAKPHIHIFATDHKYTSNRPPVLDNYCVRSDKITDAGVSALREACPNIDLQQ